MADLAIVTQKRTKRSYSPTEVGNALAVLKSNGGNIYRTASQLNIPYHTLREWEKNKRRDSDEVREVQRHAEENILDLYAIVERACLEHASKPKVIQDMGGLEAVKAASLARGSQQLMQGLPTSICAEVERQELVVILQSALNAGAEQSVIDVTPGPQDIVDSHR